MQTNKFFFSNYYIFFDKNGRVWMGFTVQNDGSKLQKKVVKIKNRENLCIFCTKNREK